MMLLASLAVAASPAEPAPADLPGEPAPAEPAPAEPESAPAEPAPAEPAPAEPAPRRLTVLPVPTVDYTPETGPSLGAVALFSLRAFDDARPSTAKVEATVTWHKQVILETGWEVFLPEDRWLVAGSVAGMRYPERWWGVGPDTPDTPEDYDAWRLETAADVRWRPWRALYVGPSQHLQWMFNVDPAPGGALDTSGVLGASGGLSSGLGYTVAWDDRTSTTTPTGGTGAVTFRHLLFGPTVGSDYTFERYDLDARAYLRTWPRHVLALQAKATLHTGAPPFRMLAMLGGDTITRGYYLGRWRDQHLLAVQAEYRAPIVWRIGAVAFVGVGEVTPRLDAHALAWLRPTFGGGLRVRVTDEDPIHLRLDYAQGIGSSAFYFGFGETF